MSEMKPTARERCVLFFRLFSSVKIATILFFLSLMIGVLYWYYSLDSAIAVDDANVQSEEVSLTPNHSGKISEISVELGDYVNEGDLLFTLETGDVQAQILLNEAELEKSLATFNLHKLQSESSMNEYFQAKKNYQMGLTSSEEMEIKMKKWQQIEGEKNIANAELKKQECLLSQLKERKKEASIYASNSGYISELFFRKGSFVPKDQSVITIRNLKEIWVEGFLHKKFLSKVKKGDDVHIKTTSYPDCTFSGKVKYIDTKIDAKGRLKIFFSIENESEKVFLMPGMKVDILFLSKR